MGKNMNITTIVFVYKRYHHAKAVLDALADNTILPQKLLIFQDGLKDEKDRDEWVLVNKLINSQDFCPKEVVVSSYNKGLARSITEGIKYALETYEAVIVLEDDCVPGKNFLRYMDECLHFYKSKEKVWGISGYAWPGVARGDSKYDIYFGGRISSWGWATWRDRWDNYARDIDVVNRLRSNKESSVYLSKWGNDLEVMMRDQISGKNDSWAVYWALNMIENRGVYVMPYVSQIKNIGLDGTGEHCTIEAYDTYNVELEQDIKTDYIFPEDVCISEEVEVFVRPLFGSYIAIQEKSQDKDNAIVYGTGGCFLAHEKKLAEEYNIEYLFDKNKSGYFAGIKLLTNEELTEKLKRTDLKVLIMINDRNERLRVKKMLVSCYEIHLERIIEFGEQK